MNTTAAVLEGVERRLEDRSRWTQKAFARLKKGGRRLELFDPNATCWCLVGALRIEVNEQKRGIDVERFASRRLNQAIDELYGRNDAVRFNDGKNRKHSQVMRVVRRARELAEHA